MVLVKIKTSMKKRQNLRYEENHNSEEKLYEKKNIEHWRYRTRKEVRKEL